MEDNFNDSHLNDEEVSSEEDNIIKGNEKDILFDNIQKNLP